MELNQLSGFVVTLVMIGMLLGAGVLILDKTGSTIYTSTYVKNESFTMSADDVKVSLANGNMTSFNGIINATGSTLTGSNYTVDKVAGTINHTDTTDTTCIATQTCYATYTYNEYNNKATTALGDSTSTLGSIASTWLGLLVTIVILAMILVIVVRSFQARQR